MTALIILITLIIANGIFAMSEIAIVSARKARLQQWAKEGDAKAQVVLELAEDPNQFLSTVQIGITLIGVLAGAFGEATIAASLEKLLRPIPWLQAYSHVISLGIVVIGITYLSLVIGELAPKRLALYNPERIARVIAPPMRTLSIITAPAIWLLSISTTAVIRLLGASPSKEPPVTEEEIQFMIEEGTEAGIFEVQEQDMVTGVFRLDDERISGMMTPRPGVIYLDLNDSRDEIIHKLNASPYSRFPVCQGRLDNVVGIVQTKDLLTSLLTDQSLDLEANLIEPLFVPETILASEMLKLFKEHNTQFALVLDEYGGVEGVITLNDIMETIIGEIELVEPQAVRRQDGSWLLDGMLPIDEFKTLFDIKDLPGEKENQYETLGGFIITYLGRIPRTADQFRWHDLLIEVADMDGRRVDKVLATPTGSDGTDHNHHDNP